MLIDTLLELIENGCKRLTESEMNESIDDEIELLDFIDFTHKENKTLHPIFNQREEAINFIKDNFEFVSKFIYDISLSREQDEVQLTLEKLSYVPHVFLIGMMNNIYVRTCRIMTNEGEYTPGDLLDFLRDKNNIEEVLESYE